MRTTRRDSLTAEQVHAGRRMREEHGTAWYTIGKNLGCDPETIRRALDPQFAELRREAQAKRLKTRYEKMTLGGVVRRCATFRPKRSLVRPKATEERDYEPTTEERSARSRATKRDEAFVNAMTKAVRMERENCPIGVDKRPGTVSPRLMDSNSNLARTLFGSSAQMCADDA